MFELLADGTVEKLCVKFKMKGIPYGFGGIASIGHGELPAEDIIKNIIGLDQLVSFFHGVSAIQKL